MKIIAVCFLAATLLALSNHVSAQVRLGVASTARLSSVARVSTPGVSNALRTSAATTRATARTSTQTAVNTTRTTVHATGTTVHTTQQVAGKTKASANGSARAGAQVKTPDEASATVQGSADVSVQH